ncbi:hypothetical protein GBF38_001400 [Nibea albiflora]|uniref:Uncharacterized protein n=1 Tax=Nibea albiflora TaxID=240163 RepID=A0ACB7EUH7_NIBAL|nr:hypothetical protein GBF38_001400 [Nibea albiflora]
MCEIIGGRPLGFRASHSCVTSAASQPSTTGRDAPRPGDLRARCVVTSAVSATLTSRLSHIAPKYRAASPNLHGLFDLHHGCCGFSSFCFHHERRGCCR